MTADSNHQILRYLRDHQDDMVEHLKKLIDLESPTNHKPSVDRLGGILAQELRELGADVDIIPKNQVGDCVRAKWGNGEGGILILSRTGGPSGCPNHQ